MKTHIQNLFLALAMQASFNSPLSSAHAQGSGVTWTAGGAFAPWRSVTSSADGTKFYAAADEIWASTDSGVTWTERNTTRGWNFVNCSADGTKLVASSGDYTPVYTSTDSGMTFTERDSSPYSVNSIASSADGTKLVAVEYGEGGTNGLIYISGTLIVSKLNIFPITNNAAVTWQYPSTGWALQQNSNLTTASWSSSSGITNNGHVNYIIIPPTGNMFFRLQQQQ